MFGWITLLRERFFFVLCIATGLICSGLAGCAQSDPASPLPRFGPAGDALRLALRPKDSLQDPSRLLPGYSYLHIGVGGRETLMVRGARPATAPEAAGDDYWYSAQAEMLQLRQGRIWRVLGMTTEWRHQSAMPPAWSQLPPTGEPVAWQRHAHRMPGYRWHETDHIQTRRLPQAPSPALATRWPQAQWFEDEVQSLDGEGRRWAFKQHFALLHDQVTYSEQCIARDLCLQLTALPNKP